MSQYGLAPTQPWAATFPRVTPTLNFGAPGGLASLPGAQGGILARGLTPAASQLGSLMTGPAGPSLPRIGTTAASFADDLAGLGGRAASSSGILSRLPSLGGLAPGGLGAAASHPFLRAGAGGVAGMVGSNLIDTLDIGGQNSNLEQGLQGVAQGAGIGAGIGSIFGGVGAGPGALIGGAAGGALGVLGNVFGFGGGGDDDDAPSPVEILGNGISAAGLTPDQTEEILQTYEVMTALAESAPEGDARDAAMQQAYDTAAAMILQKMQEQEMTVNTSGNMLALQAQAQDIFNPIATDIEDSGRQYAAALQQSMADLPPEYRAIAQTTAARELSASDRLANAYRAQAAVIPAVNQLTQYQQDYNSFAQQLFNQQMQQGMAAGGGGAQTDVAALLAGAGV